MPLEFTKKSRINIGWIVTLSILGLILISILPLVTNDQGDNISYNFALLEKTSNIHLSDLKNDIQLIIYFLWLSLIFALVSFIGLIIHTVQKKPKLGLLLMLFGCVTILFSILIVIFQIILISKIENIQNITAASIGPLPINYIYITILIGFALLVISAMHTINVAPFSIKNLKNNKIEEKKPKKDKKIKKKEENETKIPAQEKIEEKPEKTISSIQKKDEIEEWLKEEIEQTGDKKLEEPEKTVEQQPVIKQSVSPFGKKTNKDQQKEIKELSASEPVRQTEETEKVPISEKFENALSSAIQKRQTEKPDEEKTKTEQKEEKTTKTHDKEIKVRCPECKKVFSVKKEGPITKIKCPECGKEGIAK